MRALTNTTSRAVLFLIAAAVALGLAPAGAGALQFDQPAGSPFGIGGGGFLFTASDLAVGDLNGDGRSDVVTANWSPDSYSVLLAGPSGALTLQAGSPVSVSPSPNGVALGDFDDDGDLDLALAGGSDGGSVSVYAGHGNGSFATSPSAVLPAGSNPAAAAAGDLDGDGVDDLATTDYAGNSVRVFRGVAGSFSLVASGPFAVGSAPVALTIGDFDDDGVGDIATANYGSFFSNAVSVLIGDGSGGYVRTPPGGLSGSYRPLGIAAGRFDSSGNLGLVQANTPNSDLPVKLGQGDGTFVDAPGGGPSIPSHVGGIVAAADFDFDGIDDLAVPYGTATSGPDDVAAIFLGTANGQMAADPAGPVPLAPSGSPEIVATGDFDGDLVPDFATYGSGGVTVMLNAARAPDPGIMLDPDAVDFGSVPVGGPEASRSVAVESTGTTPLNVAEVELSGDDADEFRIVADGCSDQAVDPGESCRIDLAFAPGAAGSSSADLDVFSDAGDGPETAELAGTGVSAAIPGIGLDPDRADFGRIVVDEGPSAARAFTVESVGTAPLDLGAVAVAGDDPGQFRIVADGCSGRKLDPAATCRVEVAFAPGSAGAKSAHLEVPSDASGGPATAALTGTGESRPTPCESVSVRRIAGYTPATFRKPQALGVRARLTATGKAEARVRAEVKLRVGGKLRRFRSGRKTLRITGAYRNYKVPLPRSLRRQARYRAKATFTITYSSRALRQGCGFGPERSRMLRTRLAWIRKGR